MTLVDHQLRLTIEEIRLTVKGTSSSVGKGKGRRWESDCRELRGAKEMVSVNDSAEEFGSKRKLRNPVILLQKGQLFLLKRKGK